MARPPVSVALLLSLATMAPGQGAATKVGDGGGFGTYKPSRAGDGGGYQNYGAQQKALAAAAGVAYGNAPVPAGAPAAAAGAGELRRTGPLVVYSSGDRRPPALSWREQVKLARRTLVQAGTEAIEAAARGENPVETFAALSLDNDGVVSLPRASVIRVLATSNDRKIAEGAAHLLARRNDPSSLQALVNHVRDRGVADATAARLLVESGRRVGREVFLARASNARSSNPADMLSIKALGVFPGDDITVLLRRLSGDWAETVQVAAKAALARRKTLGYNTRGAYRAPPVGDRPEKIGAVPGSPKYERMLEDAKARELNLTAARAAAKKELAAILDEKPVGEEGGAKGAP